MHRNPNTVLLGAKQVSATLQLLFGDNSFSPSHCLNELGTERYWLPRSKDTKIVGGATEMQAKAELIDAIRSRNYSARKRDKSRILPELLKSMETHRHMNLDESLKTLVFSASAAMIDRLLRPIREQATGKCLFAPRGRFSHQLRSRLSLNGISQPQQCRRSLRSALHSSFLRWRRPRTAGSALARCRS